MDVRTNWEWSLRGCSRGRLYEGCYLKIAYVASNRRCTAQGTSRVPASPANQTEDVKDLRLPETCAFVKGPTASSGLLRTYDCIVGGQCAVMCCDHSQACSADGVE